MTLTLDYACLLSGGPQGSFGIDPRDLEAAGDTHEARIDALEERRSRAELGFFDLPDDEATLAACAEFAEDAGGRFRDVVVLGIGGSALGTQALHAALTPPLRDGRRPRLFVVDNVDPVLVGGVLATVDPETTLVNVISKSGSTAETMSQFLLFVDAFRSALGDRWREHVVVTTDASKGALRPFADAEGLTSFVVPDNVGGRFSVLTPVGLLPGALLGWDLAGLLRGAARGRDRALARDFERNPAAVLATTHWLFDTRLDVNVHVLFPYSHRLRLLADWWVQLDAESLGKLDAEGRGVGPTPHGAVGATDQHSQVQLFAQGPRDKVFTFLRVLEHEDDVTIPAPPAGLDGLDYLSGATFGALLDAECRATQIALADAGRPSCCVTFPRVDAESVGEWLMWMECATAYSGLLYGVDAFDQPGVEAGKLATYALMGRDGYDDERERIEARSLVDVRRRID